MFAIFISTAITLVGYTAPTISYGWWSAWY